MKAILYHDFVCPHCYLGSFLFERLEKEHGMSITRCAYLLNPATPAEGRPLPPHVQQNKAQIFANLYRMASELEVPFQIREPVSRSQRAHEAAEFARDRDAYQPFQRAVLRRYFGEGRDLYQWEVLCEAAADAGLDPDAMRQAVEEGQFQERVERQYTQAQKEGVEQIPALIFDDRHRIVGLQPYDTYVQMVEHLRQNRQE